jgi:predicted XRE-type DNA-binding protein
MSKRHFIVNECVCQICGCSFHVPPSTRKKGKGKFCSRECYLIDHARLSRLCKSCGIEFAPRPSQTRSGAGLFCSFSCYLSWHVKPLAHKFFERIGPKTESGCILWNGSVNRAGYGMVHDENGKSHLAHRLAYEIFRDEIPRGLYVLHKCDNPPCVNAVSHLFLGTIQDNSNDMVSKGRQAKGENAGMATLSNKSVVEIRERYSQGGILQRELAIEYNITQSHVSKLVNRHYRTHDD